MRRQAEDHRQLNVTQRSSVRTAIKGVIEALASGDKEKAKAAFQKAVPVIDRMARKNIIHKNAASRKVARLAQRIKKLA